MKIYRNEFYTDEDSCLGFSFHSSKRAAEREWDWAYKDEDEDVFGRDVSSLRAVPIEFDCTKTGVLRLLNRVADHPDNE